MRAASQLLGVAASAALIAGLSGAAAAQEWYPYKVQSWETMAMDSPRTAVEYVPVEKAAEPWNICVSFPHMKDAYWLAVDYGVIAEAQRSGVKVQVVEAGGYTELNKQISQIEDCVQAGAQAVVIGAISYDGLNNLVTELKGKGIPVIDVINGISSPDVAAKSLVSFGEMGAKAGEYLAAAHPAGSDPVKVAWFPGPPGAGWVEAGNTGFTGAVAGSAVEIVDTKYGDTGKEVQAQLIEDTLEANPDLDYIVGTAVTAEAAIPILRERDLTDQIKVLSYYFTPGVDQGIRRGQILAGPTDSPVIQGRIAIDQATRILEGKEFMAHVGPEIFVVSADDIDSFDSASTLAPADFAPTFLSE